MQCSQGTEKFMFSYRTNSFFSSISCSWHPLSRRCHLLIMSHPWPLEGGWKDETISKVEYWYRKETTAVHWYPISKSLRFQSDEQWGCHATVQFGKPSKYFQPHALHCSSKMFTHVNYILTFDMLLHFKTWCCGCAWRVDRHQIQSRCCSALLVGRSERLSVLPFYSSPCHQAFYSKQLRAAFDNRDDKLCAAWIENVKDKRDKYHCIHRWHKPISSLSRLFCYAQEWLAWTNSSVHPLKKKKKKGIYSLEEKWTMPIRWLTEEREKKTMETLQPLKGNILGAWRSLSWV